MNKKRIAMVIDIAITCLGKAAQLVCLWGFFFFGCICLGDLEPVKTAWLMVALMICVLGLAMGASKLERWIDDNK